MPDQNAPHGDNAVAWAADRKGTPLRSAVVIAFPRHVPPRMPSLMTRLLNSFAFAAGCLYPEFVVPLLALNEAVARNAARAPGLPRGTPPEKEAA